MHWECVIHNFAVYQGMLAMAVIANDMHAVADACLLWLVDIFAYGACTNHLFFANLCDKVSAF